MHGGLSTGASGNQNALKHGRYSAEAKAQRALMTTLYCWIDGDKRRGFTLRTEREKRAFLRILNGFIPDVAKDLAIEFGIDLEEGPWIKRWLAD